MIIPDPVAPDATPPGEAPPRPSRAYTASLLTLGAGTACALASRLVTFPPYSAGLLCAGLGLGVAFLAAFVLLGDSGRKLSAGVRWLLGLFVGAGAAVLLISAVMDFMAPPQDFVGWIQEARLEERETQSGREKVATLELLLEGGPSPEIHIDPAELMRINLHWTVRLRCRAVRVLVFPREWHAQAVELIRDPGEIEGEIIDIGEVEFDESRPILGSTGTRRKGGPFGVFLHVRIEGRNGPHRVYKEGLGLEDFVVGQKIRAQGGRFIGPKGDFVFLADAIEVR